jgi:type VII secretion-associated protein (TIGR03931 family)
MPPSGTYSFGRASVELPATWSERAETDRSLLIPPDGPDRRIVLTTVELAPGVSFDDVADDLADQVSARGERPTIDGYTRATDFGGRVGISYVESPDEYSVVRWRVFVEDGIQIGIGCQSLLGAEAALEDDCSRAASTLRVSPP